MGKFEKDVTILIVSIFVLFMLGVGVVYLFEIDVKQDVETINYSNKEMEQFCRYKTQVSYEDFKMCEDNKKIVIEKQYTLSAVAFTVFLGLVAAVLFAFVIIIIYLLVVRVKK